MKFLCLVYGEEQKLAGVDDRDCLACGTSLRQQGQLVAAEALQAVKTAKTVRVRHGKVAITDGPFAETKECVAGFYLIDAADFDAAVAIASKIPPAKVGSIEVRPVRELNTEG
jgi:hypothetical protein